MLQICLFQLNYLFKNFCTILVYATQTDDKPCTWPPIVDVIRPGKYTAKYPKRGY